MRSKKISWAGVSVPGWLGWQMSKLPVFIVSSSPFSDSMLPPFVYFNSALHWDEITFTNLSNSSNFESKASDRELFLGFSSFFLNRLERSWF